MEVSEPDVTTTINVRLNPKAEPLKTKDEAENDRSVAEVEFAETIVLIKPIESEPVEKASPEAVKKNTSNCPPKWMSSSKKNDSEDSTEADGRSNEKLNLTNRLNSVIGNGNFEKASEIVSESKDAEEVKAKPKWRRPGGASAVEAKTTEETENASKLTANPKTAPVATKKESKKELEEKKNLPESKPGVKSNKTSVEESQNKTSLDSKNKSVSIGANAGKKPEEIKTENIKDEKPKPKWKRPGVEPAAKKSPEITKKENPLASKKTENKKDPLTASSTNAKLNPTGKEKAPLVNKNISPKSSTESQKSATESSEKPKESGGSTTIPTKKNPEKELSANKTTVSDKTDATEAVETIKAVTSSKQSKPLSNEEQKLEPTKTQIERKAIADVKSAGIEKEPTLDASNPTSVEKPGTNNSDPKEEDKKTGDEKAEEEEEEEEEDASGMRAMRKEVGSKMENMEAEFAAGASKIAALRAKMKRMREAAKANREAGGS